MLSSAEAVGSETHSAKLRNEIKQVSKWQVTEKLWEDQSLHVCLTQNFIYKTSDLLKLLQERNWKKFMTSYPTEWPACGWETAAWTQWGILIWLPRWFAYYCVEPIPCLNRQAVIWGKEGIASLSLMPCQKSSKPSPDAPGRYKSIHVHIL